MSDATKDVYSVFLHVTHCDNRLEVYVNGHKVYDKYTDDDHLLNDQLLLPYIVWGNNQVRVVGTNGPTNPPNQINPYNFEFEILLMQNINGNPFGFAKKVYAQKHITSNGQTAPSGQVFDCTYDVDY